MERQLLSLATSSKFNIMAFMSLLRLNTQFLLVLASVISGILSTSVIAQEISPSQLETFKRMSPSQQQALAAQYGVELPQASMETLVNKPQQSTSVQPRHLAHTESSENGQAAEYRDDSASIVSDALKPFGYELFAGSPTSFTPTNDIPVSSDYVLGPGDSLKVNLYGKENRAYELAIDNEGSVYLPELGPLALAGMSFTEAKQELNRTIKQKMIGVNASVSMGELRSIRVFVLGEAHLPGSYVVSSLSTITNALVLSGGVAESGSLRTVQLKRKGKVIQSLDLYDLLLEGDTSNDVQLKSGDVVFIPPIGASAGVDGEVRRPAIYELKAGETAQALVNFAGGLKATAYPQLSHIERIDSYGMRTVINVDFSGDTGKNTRLMDGDLIHFPAVLDKVDQVVHVQGHVQREGIKKWRAGMRISDVVSHLDMLKPNADLRYAIIKRYTAPNRHLSVLSFSIANVMDSAISADNLVLQDQDELLFFGLYEGERQEAVEEVVDRLRMQADLNERSKEVAVSGDVRYPGNYPLTDNMSVEDLIYAAGGFTEKAFQLRAELSRSDVNTRQVRTQSRVDLNLTTADDLSIKLRSRDVLQIKPIPDWEERGKITLAGEVMFPGEYPVYKNDILKDVLQRAGGLTDYAYAPGAVFTREDLKAQQAEQLKEMQERLADDIAKAEIVASNQVSQNKKSGDISEAQALLEKLKNTPATGRLVIDLDKVIAEQEDYSIPLQAGDTLFVPMRKNSVTIIGEVQLPISQVFESELDYQDYINRSGGFTDKADDERIYIIRANGGVHIPETSNWFASNDSAIHPGDTIVVPLDADKLDQIVLWRDLSQVFYQIALGAAAVGSL